MGHRHVVAAGAIALGTILALAGAATAQELGPQPGADDLGLDTNDVRDEPSHPDDANGFPDTHEGDFWSPEDDPLILDAWVRPGWSTGAGVDLDNVVNRLQHGSNYGDHERTIYPGPTYFAAWWGWWSDHGGGGDLQESDAWGGTPFVGEPNGAIDDADDCEQADWDEFTWRGAHPCPDAVQHPAYPDDQMFGFITPGTHFSNNHLGFEGPVDTLLASRDDPPELADFTYAGNPDRQRWHVQNSQPRNVYDASLLISTSVVSAVNPQEVPTGDGATAFDPFAPAGDPGDHAVDVDIYTTPDPLVEEVYRTAVWDPDEGPHADRGDNPDLVHEDGPKGWAKDDGAAAKANLEGAADDNVSAALSATERQRGLVDDQIHGPFHHEPNTAEDDYNGWATHDADTSYGGLEGDYYEPGDDQAYPGYQDGERFWFDAQVTINSFPYWIFTALGYGGTQFTPQAPSTSEPVDGATTEDSTTQGPGILYMRAWAGTWYDGDEVGDRDTWVGDAPDDPYQGGTVEDPNTYQAEESLVVPSGASGPEWRGTCGVDVEATLYPTSDSDGDGTPDWGAAGVYVMGSFADANPYSNVWMDLLGPDADPVLDPLRESPAGGTVSGMFPEDEERLSRHRTEGPIEMRSWSCPGLGHEVGYHGAFYNVVLPTGTLDFTFKAVSNATLTDKSRVGLYGDTDGDELAGASITDVDRFDRILSEP